MKSLPIAIIGGGPVGLAAAAHLLERGENFRLFESGPEIAHSVKSWQHVRLFSPWKYNIDSAAKRLLKKKGWNEPNPDDLPTGLELREKYLIPLYQTVEIRSRTYLNSKVVSVGRKNLDKSCTDNRDKLPFIIHYKTGNDNVETLVAKAVIDTSGTWTNPNPVGSGGIPAIGEIENRDGIMYGIPDIQNEYESRYRDKTVMVVGSGHSAMQVILDLIQIRKQYHDTNISWVMRKKNPQSIFGGGKDDELPARGVLGLEAKMAVSEGTIEIVSPFLIEKIELDSDQKLKITGDFNGNSKELKVDEIIAATGFRPDLNMIREVRTDLDPALEAVKQLAPMIDPNIHSCGTVPPHGVSELKHPDDNFFIAGVKSYGRAPTFLMVTGYEQVRSIAACIAGDFESANRIELQLPETGVCSIDTANVITSVGCCEPLPKESDAYSLQNNVAGVTNKSTNAFDAPTNKINGCC